MDIFTSITLNYLPKARILAKSLKKFHPKWKFHVLISDCQSTAEAQNININFKEELFDRIFWIKNLDIPDIESWIFKHTIVELCTAVKAVFLQRLIDEGSEKIVYIDPDIVVFNNLNPIEKWLDEYAILLTPHLLDYTDNIQSIQDNEISGALRHGTFNLGFLAINAKRKDGKLFSEWWRSRLLNYCYADYDRGLFTDQKWCDLIPSFFDDYYIIRDPGYDVASWNLDCRKITFNDKGELIINQKHLLRFYHFTGYDSGAGAMVINQLTKKGANSIIREIWSWYHRQLIIDEHEKFSKLNSIFEFFENGKKITKEMRLLYRNREDLQSQFKNPFTTNGSSDNFYAWWRSNNKIHAPVHKVEDQSQIPIVSNESTEISLLQDQAQVYLDLLQIEKNQRSTHYKSITSSPQKNTNLPIKAIAFYLPQYHPIPENDTWWGKGFTEWMNVTRAIPQYIGHYQPHLPGELGFYDLRIKDIQYRQIELAKMYGIFGFAFYYYWFSGKRLLEYPVNQFLADKNLDFPFCFVWANENWTRRWDGLENDILIAQSHSPETDAAFIKDMVPYLRDERYIRVNDRPIIIVYRTDIMPNPIDTAHIWRNYCINNHLGNPYLVAAQTFGFEDPRPIGFDAAVQFPPHNKLHDTRFLITSNMEITNPENSSLIFSYPEVVKFNENDLEEAPYRLFKTVFPSWDNEPRRPGRGTIFAGSTPKLYQRWLETISRWTIESIPAEERFVFINAWNEWAEGAHLEPDQYYGYAYLQATLDALKAISNNVEQ